MCENKIIPRLTEIDIHSIFLISFFFIFLGANVSYGKEYMVKLKSVGIGFNGDIIKCGSKDGKSYVEIKKGKGPGGPVDQRTITKIEGDKQIIININNIDNTGTEMENPMYSGFKDMNPEKMMEAMGFEEGGEKTVVGYKCSVKKIFGTETCTTEDGVPLEAKGPGISEVATEVLDRCPGEYFEVGDVKLEKIDMKGIMGE